MRALVFGMSGLVLFLVAWQLLAKKGDWLHQLRYALIFFLSAAIIVVNTIYLPVKWDGAFIFHVAVGSLYLLGLVAVGVSGYRLKRRHISKKAHRWSVGLTLFFLFLTGLVPRLFR